jgi:hypothetical protein
LVKRVTAKEPPAGALLASKKKKEKSVTNVEKRLKTPMEFHGPIHLVNTILCTTIKFEVKKTIHC